MILPWNGPLTTDGFLSAETRCTVEVACGELVQWQTRVFRCLVIANLLPSENTRQT